MHFLLQPTAVLLWGIHTELGGREVTAGVTGIAMGVGAVFLRNDLLAWPTFKEIQDRIYRTRQPFLFP